MLTEDQNTTTTTTRTNCKPVCVFQLFCVVECDGDVGEQRSAHTHCQENTRCPGRWGPNSQAPRCSPAPPTCPASCPVLSTPEWLYRYTILYTNLYHLQTHCCIQHWLYSFWFCAHLMSRFYSFLPHILLSLTHTRPPWLKPPWLVLEGVRR